MPFEMLENQYLIVEAKGVGDTYYCNERGKLRKFTGGSIKTYNSDSTQAETVSEDKKGGKKKAANKYSKGKSVCIVPRNAEQACAFDLVHDRAKTIKLLEGCYGSGKTMILVNAALEALKNGEFERIIWIRNNVSCVGTKDIGYLPGDIWEKMEPWVGPFIDHAGEAAVRAMLEKETLKVEPLQYLRGRNFEHSLILCTEAENLLLANIQLIIARAAEGTQIWLDGDYHQADRKIFDESNGLVVMKERFKGNPLFGCVTLTKTERSATAAMADLLDKDVLEQKRKLLK